MSTRQNSRPVEDEIINYQGLALNALFHHLIALNAYIESYFEGWLLTDSFFMFNTFSTQNSRSYLPI